MAFNVMVMQLYIWLYSMCEGKGCGSAAHMHPEGDIKSQEAFSVSGQIITNTCMCA